MADEVSSARVKAYGLDAGASVVGIAAAKDFGPAPEGHKPSDVLEGCLSVIVLGSPFPKEVLLDTSLDYLEIRREMIEKMEAIAKGMAKHIKQKGYAAKAISPMGGKYADGKYYGHISLKHAAELAGLGRIGRNYILINPLYGSLLWFSAVLTNADLSPDTKARHTVCGGCTLCVTMCPSKALDNPGAFEWKKCDKTMFKMVDKKRKMQCLVCRTVCPHRFGAAT